MRFKEAIPNSWFPRGILTWCLVTLMCVWQLPAAAAAIDNLQPGYWYEVPNSAMQNVRPATNPGGTFESVMSGWSGAVYDTKRDRLVVWGGGHSDYAGNEVYAFDINAGQWSRLTDPSTANISRACDYPDGLPRSRHTYNYIEYLPEYDVMLTVGGSAPWIEGGGGFCQDLDAFNFATNSWNMSWGSTFQNNGDMIASWAVRHPVTGDIWRRGSYNGQLMKLDINTRQWTTYSSGGYLEIYSTPAIDPTRNILVAVGGYGSSRQIKVWDLNNPNAAPYTPPTSGATDMELVSAPGFQYDPVSDRFVAWHGGAAVYTLNPDTWVWTKVTPAAGNTVTPTAGEGRGTYGRFRYIPSKNAFVAVNRTNENVYFYKLSAGSGTNTTPIPVVNISASPNQVVSGGASTLNWSAVNADSCVASGAWSGSRAVSGSQTLSNLTADGTYTLSCSGAGGSTQKSVTITVTAATSGSAGTTGDITSVVVSNLASVAQSSVPVTFGHVFKEGDVVPGQTIEARMADGTPVPLQVDKKATHADGSLRHAVLTARIPSLGGNVSQAMVLSTTPSVATGTPVTVSDVLATGYDARVNLTIGGTAYSLSARDLLASGSTKQWLSGPEVSEWIVGGPVKSGSASHPHIAAYFHVRAYADGRVRTDVSVENGWLLVNNPAAFNVTATISMGGANVFGPTSLTMSHHTRWHQTFWWKASGAADPRIAISHDTTYLRATGAVPNYIASLKPSEAALNALNQTIIPMDNGQQTDDMGNGGYQAALGILPLWDSLYAVSGDHRAFNSVLANGSGGGAYSMHFRDESTGKPIVFSSYPNLSTQNSTMPAPSGGNPLRHEFNHQPSIGYMAYLISGDYYYLEEMQFWATWNYLWTHPGYARQGGLGIFGAEVRGQAWALRTLGQAAYITPDADPLKAEFRTSLRNNMTYRENTYASNPSANNLGALQSYDGYTKFKPWMDDFYTMTMGYLVDLGFGEAVTVRNWKSINPVGRMGTTEYCYLKGASYVLTVGTSDTNWFPDFATLYTQNHGANNSCPEGGLMGGYPDLPTGYVANLRPALATAVDSGIPGALDAWNRMVNSQVQPDFNDIPIWGISPRTLAGTPVSTPTPTTSTPTTSTPTTSAPVAAPVVSLGASSSLLQAGSSVTLNWSASNASTCTASGGWTGSKAVSGSETITGLSSGSVFNLRCNGDGGTGSDSVSVYVYTTGSTTPNLSLQDFSTYADSADPVNWFDTGANNSTAHDESKFGVFTVAGNKVLGTSFTSASNVHSHYIGGGSDQWKNYLYTGRMRVASSNAAIGVTFMSDFPNSNSYYRLRRLGNGSFHIATHGTAIECTGDTETGVVPAANSWYRFAIEVEDTGTQTNVRASVWADGASQPASWQVSCSDSGTRRTSGTVGLWAVAGSGEGAKYWDDLAVQPLGSAPVTQPPATSTPPVSSTDTDADGLLDSWEIQYFGNLAQDGSGDQDQDGLSNALELSLSTSPVNADSDGDGISDYDEYQAGTNPVVSDALLPPEVSVATDMSLNAPKIGIIFPSGNIRTAAAGGSGYSLVGVDWQLADVSDFSTLLLDRGTGLTDSISLPTGILKVDRQYWVRIAVRDNLGRVSPWSTPVSFRSEVANPLDLDLDGTVDQYEVSGVVDLDGNGVNDADEGGCSLYSAGAGATVGLRTIEGVVHCVSSVAVSSLSNSAGASSQIPDGLAERMPHGMFNFVIDGLPVDPAFPATVTVTVYFSDDVPANSSWMKYDDVTGVVSDFTDNVVFSGNTATLILTDGGDGDADGVVNGVIVDPSGIATPAAAPVAGTTSSSSDGGGGGGATGLPELLFLLAFIGLLRARNMGGQVRFG